MKHIFWGRLVGACLALTASLGFTAPYATTGAGSSTIGTGGDYTTFYDACKAISGSTNGNTVTNKVRTTNVCTLTLGAVPGFVVGDEITVSIGDTVFDGDAAVTVVAGNNVSFARNGANVASTAVTPVADQVWKINGTGTRDGTAWTFSILNDLTETLKANIRCTVAVGGSITFKPSAGVRPTVTWPSTIAATSGAGVNGTIVIGTGRSVVTYTSTNNIFFDGSNNGTTSRDMTFQNGTSDTEGAAGLFRIRGNCDGIQIKNMIIHDVANSTSNPIAVQFSSDGVSPDTNKCPDNWIVDNCLIDTCQTSNAFGNSFLGSGITSVISGTVTAQAQSNFQITNNVIYAGTRPIFSTNWAGGTIRGNVIHGNPSAGALGYGIDQSSANVVTTGYTLTIDRNIIDILGSPTSALGAFGMNGIRVAPTTGAAANTIVNITNNMIGGWIFTAAAATEFQYKGIEVVGGNTSAGSAVTIEHNSLNMNSSGAVTGGTATNCFGIGRNTATAIPVAVKNNIVRFLHTGANAHAFFALTTAVGFTANGNDIFTNTAKVGSIGGTAYATFAAWQAGGFDANGQNVDPSALWAASGANTGNDLHLTSAGALVGTGVVTTLSSDVDGEARNIAGLALPGCDVVGSASQTYTWVGGSTGAWNDAANWGPSPRTTPKYNDVISLDGVTATITDVQDQHLAGLKVLNGTSVTLQSNNGIQRLFIWNGDAGATADFSVAAGNTLTFGGPSSSGQKGGIYLDLNGSSTGAIDGDVVLRAQQVVTPHHLTSKLAGGLSINSGGTIANAPDASTNGNAFGGGAVAGGHVTEGAWGQTANTPGVVFQSGSSYHAGGLSNGTTSAAGPTNPFVLTAPNSMIEMKLGSNYVAWGTGAPAYSGRTFGYGGNLTLRHNGTVNSTGAGGVTIGGTLSTQDSLGVQGAAGFNLTALVTLGGISVPSSNAPVLNIVPASAATHAVNGNIDLGNGSLASLGANLTLNLNGSAAQSVNLGGITAPALIVNNAAGVNMTGNGTVTALTGTAGTLSTGANTLTIGTSGAIAALGTLTAANGGTLNVGTVALSGAGTVNIASGGTLQTANISGSGAEFGSLNGVTNKSISAGATVYLNGVSAQTLGSAILPASIAGITVNNPSTVTMLQNVAVTTQLNLIGGTISPNGNLLTAPDGATGVIRTAGYVDGALKRLINMTVAGGGARLFPVGSGASYAPVTLTINSGSDASGADLTVSTSNTADPNNNSPNALIRTWTLTPDSQPDGTFDAGLVFGYNDPADLGGTVVESALVVAKDTGGGTFQTFPTTVDAVNNTLTVASGVNGFSVWTAGDSTAVPVTVSAFSIE
ncbi:MAG: beta strand repeat-containing protein [Candidatus Sumerlaeaceae bacterium]